MHRYKFTSRWFETPIVGALGRVFCALDVHIRPRMASHGVSWVPGAHVCFRNLDFIITTEGELAQVPATIQPIHSTVLDTIAEALEELLLHAPKAHAPRSDQLLGFDHGRLER